MTMSNIVATNIKLETIKFFQEDAFSVHINVVMQDGKTINNLYCYARYFQRSLTVTDIFSNDLPRESDKSALISQIQAALRSNLSFERWVHDAQLIYQSA